MKKKIFDNEMRLIAEKGRWQLLKLERNIKFWQKVQWVQLPFSKWNLIMNENIRFTIKSIFGKQFQTSCL